MAISSKALHDLVHTYLSSHLRHSLPYSLYSRHTYIFSSGQAPLPPTSGPLHTLFQFVITLPRSPVCILQVSSKLLLSNNFLTSITQLFTFVTDSFVNLNIYHSGNYKIIDVTFVLIVFILLYKLPKGKNQSALSILSFYSPISSI